MTLLAPKTTFPDEAAHRRELAVTIGQMLRGRLNNTGDVTLTLSATTTVVTDERVALESAVLMMPKDANAATENWFAATANGSFTITHANNALTRSFRYAIIG